MKYYGGTFPIPGWSNYMENIASAMQMCRIVQTESRLAGAKWKTFRLHVNVTATL